MRQLILLLIFSISLSAYAPINPLQEETIIEVMEIIEEEREYEERIDNLLEAIRVLESNNNYHVKGQSGEYGAYQFMPRTWEIYCMMFVGEILDITIPENQDIIARSKIELYVDEGYNNKEIAAIWNSGTAKEWQTREGINSHGVHYSTPNYVNYFMKIFNKVEHETKIV